jgi:DNA primase
MAPSNILSGTALSNARVRMIEATNLVSVVLQELGLVSFMKTSTSLCR